MSTQASQKAIYLKDYAKPDWLVKDVRLTISIFDHETIVTASIQLVRSPHVTNDAPLRLHGVELELLSLQIDGEPVGHYFHEGEELVIPDVGKDEVRLESKVRIHPERNTSLEGLYASGGMLCTQCEAEGFRKITYYPDRPDVMACFTTTVEADRTKYPVLLANGNLIGEGDAGDGRHFATWNDPFPKPSYLFAAVAGDLKCKKDTYVTMSGRSVDLRIYVEAHDLGKVDHAMASLKKAMAWDERVYGCEYDLDIFMIVAVSHFNMGAMENKGLNIFNTSCILAHPSTATDAAFQRVESVVAHEYFHNWSGNRVTCRDWFQLSLKEGFTVFRDQQFSADMLSESVQRIEDVNVLRTWQFAEDSGPLAHAVRPASFVEINNFYTATVYEKGAEIVRMLHSTLGAEAFRKGTDLYFQRYDGMAVTVEDFLASLSEASGLELSGFMNWYQQPGTPVIHARGEYEPLSERYRLLLSQEVPQINGFPAPVCLPVPVKVGLLGRDGQDQRVSLDGAIRTTHVLMLKGASQEFVFEGVKERPVPSLLRDFSAPVRLTSELSSEDRLFLLRHDSNGFNRWLMANELLTSEVLHIADGGLRLVESSRMLVGGIVDAVQGLQGKDPALATKILQFPSVRQLMEASCAADTLRLHHARQLLRSAVSSSLEQWFASLFPIGGGGGYHYDAASIASRGLRNTALEFLVDHAPAYAAMAVRHFNNANNMTDQYASLMALVHAGRREGEECLAVFERRWGHEPLVMDQWFAVQAGVPAVETVERVRHLLEHPAFDRCNPNRVRALLGQFANANPVAFHRQDGEGYKLLSQEVAALDAINPQVAARLLGSFSIWPQLDSGRQERVLVELRLLECRDLSPDVRETLTRLLAGRS